MSATLAGAQLTAQHRSAQLALGRLERLGLIESRPSGNRIHYRAFR
jgi:hypothetical protein